jgi:ABC-type lipoprotein release transport system permease subunit
VALGIAASLPAIRVLKSFVFTRGADWVPYVAVPFLLVCTTIIATYGPARRASSIDPMKALRDE